MAGTTKAAKGGDRPTRAAAAAARDQAGGGRFAAFISYRHADADRRWAKWLHRALEGYKLPRRLAAARGLPRRVGRCFRDEEELAASADLSAEIDAALVASDWLVVVCSPRTPGSRWVDREVQRFRELGRADRVLSLLIEGEPDASFPPALCAARAGAGDRAEHLEPLAADVRAMPGEGTQGRRRHALLRLIATMRGVRYDDLRRRDQERRNGLLMAVAAASLALVAAMAVLVAVAVVQRGRAVTSEGLAVASARAEKAARDTAETRRQQAEASAKAEAAARVDAERNQARSLIAQADALRGQNDWGRAVALYRQAREMLVKVGEPVDEVRFALWEAHRHSSPVLATIGEFADEFPPADFHPDGRHVLVGDGNYLRMIDIASARNVKSSFRGHTKRIRAVKASADGTLALTGSDDGTMRLWDLQTGASTVFAHGNPVGGVDLSDDNRLVLGGGVAADATLWDARTGTWLHTFPGSCGAEFYYNYGLALSRDGSRAVTKANAEIQWWDTVSGGKLSAIGAPRENIGVSGDAGRVAVGGPANTVLVYEFAEADGRPATREAARLIGHERWLSGYGFAADGRLLTTSADGTLRVWSASPGTGAGVPSHVLRTPAEAKRGVFSRDGRMVLAPCRDKAVRVWLVGGTPALRRLTTGGHKPWTTRAAADGALAFTSSDLALHAWDTATGLRVASVHEERTGPAPRIISDVVAGRWFLRSTGGGRVELVDLLSDARTDVAPASADLRRLSLARDLRTARTVCRSGLVTVRNLTTGAERSWQANLTSNDLIYRESDDGELLCLADRATIGRGDGVGVWRFDTGELIARFKPDLYAISRLEFSPDKRRLLIESRTRRCEVWDVAAGRQTESFENVRDFFQGLSFAPGGRCWLSAHQDQSLVLWRASDAGGATTPLRDVMLPAASPGGIAISADGAAAFVADREGAAVLVLDFSHPDRSVAVTGHVEQAFRTLRKTAHDARSHQVLGEWFGLRGLDEWAVERYADAGRLGEPVPSLPVGQAYVRLGRHREALPYYRQALAVATAGDQRLHLRLCVGALERLVIDYEFAFTHDGGPFKGEHRRWRRVDAQTWHERYPGGRVVEFKVVGPAAADGPGVVVYAKETDREVLIPPWSDGARLRVRQPGQPWRPLAPIRREPYPTTMATTAPSTRPATGR